MGLYSVLSSSVSSWSFGVPAQIELGICTHRFAYSLVNEEDDEEEEPEQENKNFGG